MQPTQKQRQYIQQYLKAVESHMSAMAPHDRQRSLRRLQERIEGQLNQGSSEPLSDEQVSDALRQFGAPKEQAASLCASTAPTESHEKNPKRVWLGLCAALAEQSGIDAFWIRAILVLVALAPPVLPFLLTAYIAAFLFVYYSDALDTPFPPIDYWLIARRVLAVAAIGVALFIGAEGLMWLARRLAWNFLEQQIIFSGDWGWLELHGGALLFWTLFTAIPLAVLSALPVREDWSGTLRKLSQAVLAVYALVLCVGLGSFLAGTCIYFADNMAGFERIESLL